MDVAFQFQMRRHEAAEAAAPFLTPRMRRRRIFPKFLQHHPPKMRRHEAAENETAAGFADQESANTCFRRFISHFPRKWDGGSPFHSPSHAVPYCPYGPFSSSNRLFW